jgi:hypothetical protein
MVKGLSLVSASLTGGRDEMRRSGASRGSPTREARLKRERAGHYLSIPARLWTDAARLAQLVAAEQGPTHADRLLPRWPLPDIYFEFRGGTPRTSDSIERRTRRGDRIDDSLERRTSERRSSASARRGRSGR